MLEARVRELESAKQLAELRAEKMEMALRLESERRDRLAAEAEARGKSERFELVVRQHLREQELRAEMERRDRSAGAVMERCGPTDELIAQLQRIGPTDLIQRALAAKEVTEDQARGLEAFAGIRRVIGVAEHRDPGIMGKLLPSGGGTEISEARRARALEAYREACAYLDRAPGAHDACTSICDNRAPRDMRALRLGAMALAALFIEGRRAA